MTSLPGSRLLRMPGLFCAVLCQSMQQRRVGCALNLAAREKIRPARADVVCGAKSQPPA